MSISLLREDKVDASYDILLF